MGRVIDRALLLRTRRPRRWRRRVRGVPAGGLCRSRSSSRPRLPRPAGPRSSMGAIAGRGWLRAAARLPGGPAARPGGMGWHSRQGPVTLVLAARDLRLRTHPVAALASVLPGKAILKRCQRGTGPGSGRRDRAGARRGLGHQPAAGDGEGSGRANGRPEESRRGTRGRVVRPQTTRAAVPGDPGPRTSAAPPAASAAVPVSGPRPGCRAGGDGTGGLSSRFRPRRHA
jgi:hypothetical protein